MEDLKSLVLAGIALVLNVMITLMLITHLAPQTAKPIVCIPMTMQEDDLPVTNTVNYVGCP